MNDYIATKPSLWINCTNTMTHVIVSGIIGAEAPQFNVLMDETRKIEFIVKRDSQG